MTRMQITVHLLLLAVIISVLISANHVVEAQALQVGFYNDRCNAAESIVQQAVTKAFVHNPGIAAGLIRMHFHDCFVNGCDGSVLIDSTPGNTAEKDSPANNPSLRGFEVIDEAKTNLEATCKGIVSCADILAFAARDSAKLSGGVSWAVPAGRRDGTISRASDIPGNLPPPTFDVDQLTQNFASKGLSQQEMVTLSGAHTIGRSHCSSFSNRLYNFNTTNAQDPSLDVFYATALKLKCPRGNPDPNTVVPMDTATPTTLDNAYYGGVRANRGLFTSDQTLLTDPTTAKMVTENSLDILLWQRRFSAAMVRMGEIGVKTGNEGEIRLNCRVINS